MSLILIFVSDLVEKSESRLRIPSLRDKAFEPTAMAPKIGFNDFDLRILFHGLMRYILDGNYWVVSG